MEQTPSYTVAVAEEAEALISQIADLDYARSALEQVTSYIEELKRQIKAETAKQETLKRRTQKELYEHEKYRDSHVRKFAHRVTGKSEQFDSKAVKEEKEYFEALQEQKACEDGMNMRKCISGIQDVKPALTVAVQSQLLEANQTKAEYQEAAKKHDALQSQLDRLYDTMFEGPSPDFPEEDAQENVLNEARRLLEKAQQKANSEKAGLGYVKAAYGSLGEGLKLIEIAMSASRADMMGFMDSWAARDKRNALNEAQSRVLKAHHLIGQARTLTPTIQDFGHIEIEKPNIWSDVIFDNVFSDWEMHKRIEGSARDLFRAREFLGGQIPTSQQRLESAQRHQQEEGVKVREARRKLQNIRHEVLKRAKESESRSLPPEYSAS